MKVSGFSFIRNAIKYDYPIVEAIRSVLPLCDDFYIAVGKSEDETLKLICNLDSKIKILETTWDDGLREGGKVLAMETNKALKMIPADSDWCLYIQADEGIHEKHHDTLSRAMKKYKEDKQVDGLLLSYLHFFGSYDYIATAPNWYRNEIRVIKNNPAIYSYKDAQGFRKGNNKKLRVKAVQAEVFHYGWVRHPETQLKKIKSFHQMYAREDWNDKRMINATGFDYSIIDTLARFKGTHPGVFQDRINRINWEFDYDLSENKVSVKGKIKKFFETNFGFIPGEYRNYKII